MLSKFYIQVFPWCFENIFSFPTGGLGDFPPKGVWGFPQQAKNFSEMPTGIKSKFCKRLSFCCACYSVSKSFPFPQNSCDLPKSTLQNVHNNHSPFPPSLRSQQLLTSPTTSTSKTIFIPHHHSNGFPL